MDSTELTRKVAEAMGKEPCPFHEGRWLRRMACGPSVSMCAPFDLADARDREAAIEWLNAKGMDVTIDYPASGGAYVEVNNIQRAGTIEEAFGRAFLAAMGVQG